MPQRIMPQRIMPQRTMPQRTMLQRTTLQRTTPQRTMPQRTMPQRTTPQLAARRPVALRLHQNPNVWVYLSSKARASERGAPRPEVGWSRCVSRSSLYTSQRSVPSAKA